MNKSGLQSSVRYFEAAIKDDAIYERGIEDNPQVGVTLAVYTDLQDEHEELIEAFNSYQDKLQNLECPACQHKYSAIKTPMSLEEQVQSLMDLNSKQSQRIDELTALVTKLIGAADEQTSLPAERDSKGRFVASENKRSV